MSWGRERGLARFRGGWGTVHKGRKISGFEEKVHDLTLVLGMMLSGRHVQEVGLAGHEVGCNADMGRRRPAKGVVSRAVKAGQGHQAVGQQLSLPRRGRAMVARCQGRAAGLWTRTSPPPATPPPRPLRFLLHGTRCSACFSGK